MSVITKLLIEKHDDNDIFHYVIMYMGTRVTYTHT